MDSTLSDSPIQSIKGIGPQKGLLFNKIGIKTVREALLYLPWRYEDRSSICPVKDIREGCAETVRGRIVSCGLIRPRGKKVSIFEILLGDGTGTVKARWFNQPFMQRSLKAGQDILLWGEAKKDPYFSAGFVIDSPEYEPVSDGEDFFLHVNRVVPIYRVTEGISQKQFRKIMFGIVKDCAEKLSDPVPPDIIRRQGLPPLRESVTALHFPEKCDIGLWNRGESAYHKRLAFDELFMFELGIAVLRREGELRAGHSFKSKGRLRAELERGLPFSFTKAQKRVLKEISEDMERPAAMRRLLQGDVGCGKTVVAFSAMLNAVECGFQTAFMAPTAILAEQHYRNICKMAAGLGLKIALLTGGVKERQLAMIASGRIPIVVGTHALIEESVTFGNLGMVVIDEQHKFGVSQRIRLRKKGMNPDVLVMTATPIPRSLALTLYGDLDYSVIDEVPAGRRPVDTRVFLQDQKEEIYAILEEEIGRGRQAYVVYPVIEESEHVDLRAAAQGKIAFERVFPAFRVGLLHGRMTAGEKEAVMRSFAGGEIDLLVSTTVIEVGVDVPNATVMLIIHAERFGLAQLHQLRGRVGRGAESSRCLLVAYGCLRGDAGRRLDVIVGTNDGFRIAQEDLAIRGPGEFMGTLQAGMPGLKAADLIRDLPLLQAARNEAFALYDIDRGLHRHSPLRKSCTNFWNGRIDFIGAG
jgi:ATP-dependent DNA helicase RecG